jgi:hypothetical protein
MVLKLAHPLCRPDMREKGTVGAVLREEQGSVVDDCTRCTRTAADIGSCRVRSSRRRWCAGALIWVPIRVRYTKTLARGKCLQ